MRAKKISVGEERRGVVRSEDPGVWLVWYGDHTMVLHTMCWDSSSADGQTGSSVFNSEKSWKNKFYNEQCSESDEIFRDVANVERWS